MYNTYVVASAEETEFAWDLPRFRFGNGRALGSGELLRRFFLLPLLEPKPSNKDSVARRSMSGTVALSRLAPLVVVSAFLDLEPARRSASGSMETTIPRHSCTAFPFFATNSYSMMSPTCTWAREGCTTAVLLMATTLDSQISSTVLS